MVASTGPTSSALPRRSCTVRAATWLAAGIRRDDLSPDGQKDISQRPAFFELQHGGDEILDLLPGQDDVSRLVEGDQ